jgi:hypothetical protein
MRAKEFINEAYHSKLVTSKIGDWNVHVDSHAFVSHVDRNITLGVFTNIITSACLMASPELEKIPRGTGAFIQDINTKISIYVSKSKSFPRDITVETVLSPTMTPKEPVIRIDAPPNTIKELPRTVKATSALKKDIQAKGRDEVAQTLIAPPPMNREQRRAWKKKMRAR